MTGRISIENCDANGSSLTTMCMNRRWTGTPLVESQFMIVPIVSRPHHAHRGLPNDRTTCGARKTSPPLEKHESFLVRVVGTGLTRGRETLSHNDQAPRSCLFIIEREISFNYDLEIAGRSSGRRFLSSNHRIVWIEIRLQNPFKSKVTTRCWSTAKKSPIHDRFFKIQRHTEKEDANAWNDGSRHCSPFIWKGKGPQWWIFQHQLDPWNRIHFQR